ncbi:MAG: NAD(P)-dependent oxidoreductase [Agathobaculum sp.]|uniref:NAD-dependent epimerase/dehydratase family protein n=3 Tax=Agathobaculum sp. TaxID=2048138 RepID=UPI0025C189AC|nr:NAD(P)-dependent oxidoreductase [Agathobaculum sp.]MCI7125404.1 NAD(P)-dependent oxidoreductase [Agathobaculum sp.]
MKTAVVTGATGFIGKAFTKYLLLQGYQVIAVVRKSSRLKDIAQERLFCVEADFDDYDDLHQHIKEANIFYHFAWSGAYGLDTANFEIQLKNTMATCKALVQAAKIGCKKFVLAGTVAELEVLEHIDHNVCAPRGTCIYAAAKLNAEMMCKTLAMEHSIEFNAGLFANIIGPGDYSHRSTNSILNMFIHNVKPKLVKGDGLNDWLYINDAVRLIEAMGEHGRNMKTYYIGHINLWPLRKIIEKARDTVAPNMQLTFGEYPDAFLTDYRYISTKELFEDTGCKAEYDFAQAVRETAEWVKQLDWGI